MTIAAHLQRSTGTVYYLQRTDSRDFYEIRVLQGRKSRLIKRIESKSEWSAFVASCTA